MVLICLVAFFVVVAGVNAIMIRAAVSTFGGVETDSSYKAGLAFARDVTDAEAQEARHWQVQAQLVRLADGATRIELSVQDAARTPIGNVAATVRLAHPTDRRFDLLLAMDADGPGRFRGVTRVALGQRDLVIELVRGGERVFRSKSRVVLR
jgi:nitrogen fixation protein FixH